MSWPSEYENGANSVNDAHGATDSYGAHGAHPDGGAPQGPPNVYHPQPESAPSYEAYADPAVAHGWLNAYDETREMPPVVDRPSRRKPKRSAGRGAVKRRSSAGPSWLVAPTWRSRISTQPRALRGAAVAAGVLVTAVSAAALIAGFSAGPSGGAQGEKESATPAVGDFAGSTAPESSGGAALGRSSGGVADSSGAASPSPSAPANPTASEGATREPSAGTSATGATATSAPSPGRSTSGPGNSGNNPGRGQGGTKGPKQP